jgi:hypothetical protein
MIPNTSAARAETEISAPTGSSRGGRDSRVAGTIASVPASASPAITTLSTKIDGQENHSRSSPDVRRPRTPPPAATPTHVPTALPRSSGGKIDVITESVTGITKAAPTPIATRSAISSDGPWTKIAARDASPKIARPPASTVFLPMRSPIAPAGSRSAANANA